MDLVRMPREEAVYDREAVLGRDTSSVFPKEAEKAKKDKLETIKKAVGLDSSRFITESQLEAIKKERGVSVEDGTVARDKTLAAVLAENKAKKEEEFANVWKTMKQGKNRPLDEDDMAFVDSLAEKEHKTLRELREAERQELDAYQQAVRARAESHKEATRDPRKVDEENASRRPAGRKRASANVLVIKSSKKGAKQARPLPQDMEAAMPGNAKPGGQAAPNARSDSIVGGIFSGYDSSSDSETPRTSS